jgi:O-antigen/teichoic acid export membrane protein
MSLIAFPVLWGISSIAPDLINIALGQKWSIAIVPLQVLSLVIPVRMISNLMSPALLGIGRPEINFYNVITAFLILPWGFLVGCYWGIIGVSVAWATIFPVVFLINLSRVIKKLKIGLMEVLNSILRPVIAAVIMYISVVLIRIIISNLNPITCLSVSVVTGAVVYVGMIITLDRNSSYEVIQLIRIRS